MLYKCGTTDVCTRVIAQTQYVKQRSRCLADLAPRTATCPREFIPTQHASHHSHKHRIGLISFPNFTKDLGEMAASPLIVNDELEIIDP